MMNRFYQTGNFAPHFVAAMLFAFLMSFAFPQTASAYVGQDFYYEENGVQCRYRITEEDADSKTYSVTLMNVPTSATGHIKVGSAYYNDKYYKVTAVDDAAFINHMYVTHVNLQFATDVGNNAFKGCRNLRQVYLRRAELIGSGAFEGCEKLEGLYLPSSIRVIRGNILKGCENLKYLSCRSQSFGNVSIQPNAFALDDNNSTYPETVYVPVNCVDAYKNHDAFKNSNVKEATSYGLEVVGAGIQVDDFSRSYLSFIAGLQEGNLSFAPEINTLTFDNSEVSGFYLKNYGNSGLNVYFKGVCRLAENIYFSDSALFSIRKDTRVYGDELYVNLENKYSRAFKVYDGAYLTLDSIWLLSVTGVNNRTFAGNGGDETLFIRSSGIKVACAGEVMSDFKYIRTENIDVAKPEKGAWFREVSNKRYALVDSNGVKVEKEALILPAYPLSICGKKVNTQNYQDLTTIDGVTGNMVYFDEYVYHDGKREKTLVLNNATLFNSNANTKSKIIPENCGSWAVKSEFPELSVKVSGKCRIINDADKDGGNSSVFFKGVKFWGGTGKDTLEIVCNAEVGVYAGDTMVVDGLVLIVNAQEYGITSNGYNKPNCTLVIKKSVVECNTNFRALSWLKDVILEDCEVVSPEGAEFDKSRNNVLVLDGEGVKNVLIAPTNSPVVGIGEVESAKNCNHTIYTIEGTRLNRNIEDLPRGVYIIDGKKVIRK